MRLKRALPAIVLAITPFSSALYAKDTVKPAERTAIESFFSKSISGNAGIFYSKETVKPAAIPQVETEVWNLWKEANKNADEEKLPELKPMSEGNSSVWHLPAELEPNADMSFYWGYKGDAEQYPLFLYLHGSGPREHEWANGLRFANAFDDAPSVYFVPRIPNEGEYYRWWQKAKLHAWDKLLRQALASGKIDPDKIYFFGISEGGYGSQRLASYYADYLAAAGPMAGGEPLVNAPAENLRNTPFSLRTGADDRGFYRNILTGYTNAELDSLERLHPGEYKHWIELIPGRGHAIDYKPTTPWLSQFKRNPYPKHITWENLEIDGMYRDAFYNITVQERSNKDFSSRTRYDMDIDGNDINLTVSTVTYTVVEKDKQWGIGLKYRKDYTPAETGKFTVYLNDSLVDLSKPVTITVNGRKAFSGKLKCTLADMVNSCAVFGDPRRIYPASVSVTL